MLQKNRTDDIVTGISITELFAPPKHFERSASHVHPARHGLPPHIHFHGDLPRHQNNEF